MLDIRSVATILDVVEEWEGTFSGDGIGYPTVWYRGQSDALWDLLPGAFRDKFIKAAKVGSPWVSEESRPLMREITLNKLLSMAQVIFLWGPPRLMFTSSPSIMACPLGFWTGRLILLQLCTSLLTVNRIKTAPSSP